MSQVVSNKPFAAPSKAALEQEQQKWIDPAHVGNIVLDCIEALKEKFPGVFPEFDFRDIVFYPWQTIPDFYEGIKRADQLVKYAVLIDSTKKYAAYGCLKCGKIIIGRPDMIHWPRDKHRTESLEFSCMNCGEIIYQIEF